MHGRDYRFALVKYNGKNSRCTCPSCGQPRCFTPYVDTDTGALLPDEYGRCNREINCGYSLSPYTRPANGGHSYAWAVEHEDEPPAVALRPRLSLTVAAPAVPVCIPADVLRASLGTYERNTLARLIQQHFGGTVADELLARFQVGTSAYWPGACVFWLVDEVGRVRGGQVVLYDETGHTVKEPRRCTTWAHTALAATCHHRGTSVPDWLAEYEAKGQKSPCLFGLPQLDTAPVGQPIAVVESAKTAILATPYIPAFIWMATGSLANLTEERLAPIKDRRITLWPDASTNGRAHQLWADKAAELRGHGYDITVSDYLEKTCTQQQKAEGYDLADLILEQYPGYPPSWDNDTL